VMRVAKITLVNRKQVTLCTAEKILEIS